MGFFEPNVDKMQKQKDVKGLVKALSYKDPGVRYNALQALFSLGLAAELLTSAKTQKAWPLCDQIISQLAMTPDPKAAGSLVAVLADASDCLSPEVVGFAVKALDKMGWKPARIEDAPPIYMKIKLREYIQNDQRDICVQIGAPVIPYLLELLRYETQLESRICDILQRIGAQAVEPLIAAIGSKKTNEQFDHYVVQTLGRINDPRVFTFLMNRLDKNVEPGVRRAAIGALGNLGHSAVSAVDALLVILNTKIERPSGSGGTSPDYVPSDALQRQTTDDIRIWAAAALGQIGDSRAVDPLIAVYQNDWNHYLHKAAYAALKRIGDTLDAPDKSRIQTVLSENAN